MSRGVACEELGLEGLALGVILRSDFLVSCPALLDRHVGDVCADEVSDVALLPLEEIAALAAAHIEDTKGRAELYRIFDPL